MGLSSSCKTLKCFSTTLEWIARNKLKIAGILHLFDDSLIVSPSVLSCDHQLKAFLRTCDELGVTIAQKKNSGPQQYFIICSH